MNNAQFEPVNPQLQVCPGKSYIKSRKAPLCAFFVSGIALAIAKRIRGSMPLILLLSEASINNLFPAFAAVDKKLARLDAAKFFVVLKLPVL